MPILIQQYHRSSEVLRRCAGAATPLLMLALALAAALEALGAAGQALQLAVTLPFGLFASVLGIAAGDGSAEPAGRPTTDGAATRSIDDDRLVRLLRSTHERSPEAFELLCAARGAQGGALDFVRLYANPTAAALFRGSVTEPMGRRLLEGGDPLLEAARCAHCAEVLDDNRPRHAAFSHADALGNVRWYHTLTVPLGDDCLAVTTRAAEPDEDSPVPQAQGWTDELLSSVNHELRTPLNAIVGWAHLLGREEVDQPLTQRAADAIGRNAQSLASLVDDLLDINRIVTGALKLRRMPCDVGAAVLQAVEAARPAAQARWVRVDTSRVAAPLLCEADPKRLSQLLGNLLTRAVQSTPLDGAIEVSASKEGSRARIRIRDSGDGHNHPGTLAAVRERFGQADSAAARRHGGLGLGLAIVQSLVELHGGRLNVKSDGPGLGTTVDVELPMMAASDAAAAAAADLAAAQPPAAPAGRDGAPNDAPLAWRRILVLEDEADSLDLMCVLLREQGATVCAFDNAEQALAAAENASFDLIISDLGLAGMDGIEFMRRLKRRPLPVNAMALTAYAGEAQRAMALQAGYTRVEIKPISPPEFLEVVIAESARGAARHN